MAENLIYKIEMAHANTFERYQNINRMIRTCQRKAPKERLKVKMAEPVLYKTIG